MPMKTTVLLRSALQSNTRWQWIDRVPQMLAIVPLACLENTVFNQTWVKFIGSFDATLEQEQRWLQLMHPEDFEHFSVLWQITTRQQTELKKECRIRYQDGSYHWCLVSAVQEEGGPDWIVSCVDVHDALSENRILSEKLKQQTNMLDASVDCVKVINTDGHLVHMNRAGCLALGVPLNSKFSQYKWLSLLPPEIQKRGKVALKKAAQGHIAQFSGRSENATQIEYWDNILTPQFDNQGQVIRLLCVSRNISAQRKAEISLQEVCDLDELTGLMNRRSFKKGAMAQLALAKKKNQSVGLVVVDLDHFKHVNDTLGHAAGDHLLRVFARRMQHALQEQAQVARLGGDEFAVIIPNVTSKQDVLAIAQNILTQLEKPIHYAGKAINGGMSIGCALYPQHSDNYSGLMRCADTALNDVKSTGRGMISMFNEQMMQNAERLMSQLNLARAILRDDLIIPHYQPKFCLKTGQVIGFEALLRWRDALNQIQYPSDILEAFQNYELATKISRVMQDKIFQDIATWLKAGLKVVPVSINIAPIEFLRDDCAEQLLLRLEQYQIPAYLVQVEITEHIFLHRGRTFVTRALQLLRARGIKIALDDFGTGYSSLTHLRDYAVDYLKIDCHFVQKMHEEPSILAIVKAICQLAPSFSLDVIAEGVENDTQKEMLLASGCLYGQGFLCSADVSADAVPAILENVEV